MIQAVAFTTGTGTYTLSSVGIYLDTQFGGNPDPSINIYGDDGGNPDTTILIRLTNPGTIQYNAVNSFTPPDNTTLNASTTYWVVTTNANESNGTGLWVGLTNRTLDTGTAVGWSLGNARLKIAFERDIWTATSRPLLFEIRGTGGTTATGAPTITGTAQVGQTLTATVDDIADDDGLTTPGYTYQWIRVDGNTETDISEATASTYTLVTADQGKTIKVRVSFTDNASNPETLTSEATAIVTAAPNTPATGAPTITGTAQVGQTLTAETAAIMDANGLTTPNYTYQWIRVDGNTETDISEATASTYTLVTADQGMTIKVRVSFTDNASNAERLTSVATTAVEATTNNFATGAPTITGTAQVGQTLTATVDDIADDDGLTTPGYTYQWIRVDGNTETDISEATASTYTLVTADQGMTIKVRVSFTDNASNAERLTSVATTAVEATTNNFATGAPTITGTAQVGQTLTATVDDIADDDGLTTPGYNTYQWIRVDGNTETDISEATASTYTLVTADQGMTIKVRVSFTDNASNAERLTSVATTAVEAATNNFATGAPTITGTAQVGQTLTADGG